MSPNHLMRTLFGFLLLAASLLHPLRAQILFDAIKAETAGNADWVIDADTTDNPQRIPTPPITDINASTGESYWKGGLSAWGVALAKLRNAGQITLGGNGIETLPPGAAISYGNTANPQDLSNYQIYVVCEPNILFTADEKTAIVNYVKNGGCLFLIADHSGADRNGDGDDPVEVWNDLLTNNGVEANPFGFIFNSVTVTPIAVVNSSTADPLTHGAAGVATQFAFSSGATMTITNTASTHASVWQTNPTKVMVLHGTYGSGRFVAIGDSSPVDDGTGAIGDNLFDGWNGPSGNGVVALNATLWLLANGSDPIAAPLVTSSATSGVTANGATLNASVNPNGAATTVTFAYGPTTDYGSTATVAGDLNGGFPQNAAVSLTGLAPSTVYHFRASATNSAGTTTGVDQTFTTTAADHPDLTITKTHTALFQQGAAGFNYTITVANSGAAATSGTVTVVDTIPPGLTATAFAGAGWTVDLATLTATRSDALAVGASYPPLILTVNVAIDAAPTVTNSATVSGTGEINTANNTANDLTSILPVAGGGAAKVVISQIYGGGGGLSALYRNDYIELFNSGGTTANLAGWSVQYASSGGSSWQLTTLSGSIAPGRYYLVRQGGGTAGEALPAVDATGILNMSATSGKVALVNTGTALVGTNPVTGATVVDFVGYGAANAYEGTAAAPLLSANFAAFRSNGGLVDTNVNASDFAAITPLPRNSASPANLPPVLVSDLVVTKTHVGAFAQADLGRTYVLTVSNTGNGPTAGEVNVVDLLPAGLTATAFAGTGWDTDLSLLAATRSDALAAGASYPPLTLTVNVAVDAAASVTNRAGVYGGGEANTSNNAATDPTAISAITPSEVWRFANFGTTANTGDAADTAIIAGDGLPNFLKYALDLDPYLPGLTGITSDVSTGFLRLTISRNPAATDIVYQVEVTSTLGDSASWTTDGTSIDQDIPALLQVSDGVSVFSGLPRFMRLRVTRP